MASSEINPRDVVDALETLTHDQTKELFFHLGVDLHVMSNLASDYKGNMCKIQIVQTWFDKGVEVNWSAIIAGLKKIKINALGGSLTSQHNIECTDCMTSDLTNPPVPPQASGVTQSTITTTSSDSPTTVVSTAPPVTTGSVPTKPLTSSDLTVSVTTETVSIIPDGPGTSTNYPATRTTESAPSDPATPDVSSAHPVTDSPINPTQPVVPTTHPVTDSPINLTQPVVQSTHPVTTDRVKQVREEIEQLQDSFTTIVSKTRSALCKKEAQDSEFVDNFRDYLLFFPASKKAVHVKCLVMLLFFSLFLRI